MSQLRVTGNAIISGAGQSLQLTSASDVYLNVTRGASILNIGIDATGSFYNTNTSHRFFTNSGTINALTLGSTGIATFSGVGNRPVTIDGNVNIKADAGGWAMQHGFIGSLGTERGGFGAYGTADALNYYYIGIYGAEKMIITSGGNVLIGTTTDSGEKLQVSGITKTTGLSLSGTTATTSQTITSAFYMWIFNGASGQTLTLYSASGHNNTHFIKNSSANSLTLATSGNNIETLTSTTAVSSITIPAFKTVEVISNGGGVWIVMNQS